MGTMPKKIRRPVRPRLPPCGRAEEQVQGLFVVDVIYDLSDASALFEFLVRGGYRPARLARNGLNLAVQLVLRGR